MEGKKKKRKVGGIILLCMSFLLVIVLTFTMTLAWFFDSDWASNYVTMAGSVGIELRDNTDKKMHGSKGLYFNISTLLAYPGQAIDCSAKVYNNGGISVSENNKIGSACYVRARFIVYTDIDESKSETDIDSGKNNYLNATILYEFLNSLISKQNSLSTNTKYHWEYFRRTGGLGLSTSGTSTSDTLYYLEGGVSATQQTGQDEGYFYLCMKDTRPTGSNSSKYYLYSLPVSGEAVYLWNDQFILPWQLTNVSADKHIFVAIEFQAIQTFIPEITNGVIASRADNQAHDNERTAGGSDPYYVLYDNTSVQTVFNSINFRYGENAIVTNIDGINFGAMASVSRPTTGS